MESITGTTIIFASNQAGNIGEFVWLSVVPDAATADSLNASLAENSDYIASWMRAAKCSLLEPRIGSFRSEPPDEQACTLGAQVVKLTSKTLGSPIEPRPAVPDVSGLSSRRHIGSKSQTLDRSADVVGTAGMTSAVGGRDEHGHRWDEPSRSRT